MSIRKDVIARYIDGFRRSDHALVLACLTEDFVWELYGHKTVRGRAAFAAEIDSDFFEYKPVLEIHRMIEEGDAIAVTGAGSARKDGDTLNFVFSEVFHFEGDRIRRLETWHIWTGVAP